MKKSSRIAALVGVVTAITLIGAANLVQIAHADLLDVIVPVVEAPDSTASIAEIQADTDLEITEETSKNCIGSPVTAEGTNGSDNMNGTSGPDVFLAKDGADTVTAYQAGDRVCAGAGNDTVYGGADADQIRGSRGSDSLFGQDGGDAVIGSSGGDTVKGGAGADGLDGRTGSDNMYDGDGSDTVIGGSGVDDFFLCDDGDPDTFYVEDQDNVYGPSSAYC